MKLLKLFTRKWLPITLIVLIAAIGCVRLGFWQLDRLHQRQIFNAHVRAMQALQPLILPAQGELTNMEYRQVNVSGVYDFENQIGIRNQYLNNVSGYDLLTPLRLGDGSVILIDRGWIPATGNSSPSDWGKYDKPGEVTLLGVIRLSQTTSVLDGMSDPTLVPGQKRLDFWVFINLDGIRAQMPYPILPVYIQLNADPGNVKPPIPSQPVLDLSDGPHQSYAIQWFSFASVLFIGYPIYISRQERQEL